MKHFILLAYILLSCSLVFSQNYSIHEVDQLSQLKHDCKNPNSIDCFENSLVKYVNENIDIMNLINGGEGIAYVQFVITPSGNIKDVRTRSASKPLQKEAERIFQKMHFKEPAKKDGKPVSVIYTFPVKFQKKEFNNYDEFFEEDILKKDFMGLSDVATPPEIKNCDSGADCLNIKLQNDIIEKLKLQNYNTQEISKLKITFVITSESEVDNMVVIATNRELQNATRKILEGIKVISPALDENNKPVSVQLYYKYDKI